MPTIDWKRERDEMLASFDRQATFHLKRMRRSGKLLDEDFQKYILDISNKRYSFIYLKFETSQTFELTLFVSKSEKIR